jgi:hypothetical protein
MEEVMRVRHLMVPIALAAAAGCASQPPRQTTDELARAQALVGEAEQGGAQQYAAEDLQSARDKLNQANELSAKRPVEAQHLATESQLDAQLAAARADSGKAQHAVQETNQSLDTLRNEEARHVNQSAPAASPSPPAGTGSAPQAGSSNATPPR